MPSFWNGNGQIVRTDGVRSGSDVWQQAAAAAVDIEPDDHDHHDEGLALSIADCINRNGENSPTAPISWGNQRLTDLAAGSSANDAVRVNQMQLGQPMWAGDAAGTANAIELTVSPALSSYGTGGLRLQFRATATNTGAVTVKVGSLSALNLRDMFGDALPARAIVNTGIYTIMHAGSDFRLLGWVKPPKVEVLTSSTTWLRTEGVQAIQVEVIGGGGGGAGAEATAAGEAACGAGGGAGGYARKMITNPPSSATVTVGSGGSGGVGSASHGSNGGNSSWADGTNTLTANGGVGGTDLTTSSTTIQSAGGGDGGTATGGDVNVQGGHGERAMRFPPRAYGGAGGNSVYGTGGPGVGGGGSSTTANGNVGQGRGSGGGGASNSGAQSAATGGDGTAGVVIVTSYF